MNGFCYDFITVTRNRSTINILTKKNLKDIYQKNLEFLAFEIYNSQNCLPPPIMNDIFIRRQGILISERFKHFAPLN